jgi:DNA-binding transcriptional regulator YdaS (Cro superfamily)
MTAGPDPTVAAAVRTLGSRAAVADLLGVGRSVVDRWLAGSGRPSPAHQRVLRELATVSARLARYRDVPPGWFRSPCAALDGATPEDVLVVDGADRVLDAIARELDRT